MDNDFLSSLLTPSPMLTEEELLERSKKESAYLSPLLSGQVIPEQEVIKKMEEKINLPKPKLAKASSDISSIMPDMSLTEEEIKAANDFENESIDSENISNKISKKELDYANSMESELQKELSDLQKNIEIPTEKPEEMPQVEKMQQPKISRYEELLNAYKNLKPAQEAYQSQLNNLAILQGANQIAQGMARGYGADIGSGQAGIEALKESARYPIQSIEEQLKLGKQQLQLEPEVEMNDPNSDISNFYRQQAYSLLQRISPDKDFTGKLENMSATQLQKLPGMSSIQKPVETRYVTVQDPDGIVRSKLIRMDTGEVVKDLGMAGYAYGLQINPKTGEAVRVSKADPYAAPIIPGGAATKLPEVTDKTQPVKIDFNNLNVKQIARLEELQKGYLDETKETREQVNSAYSAMDLIKKDKPVETDSDKRLIRTIQTKIARASGEKGALSEGDVQSLGGSQAILDALERWLTVKTFGDLTETDKNLLLNTTELMTVRAQEYLYSAADLFALPFADRLSSELGQDVDKDSIRKLIGVEAVRSAMGRGRSKSKEEKRRMPNGKIAIFDRDTKKFLRYEE